LNKKTFIGIAILILIVNVTWLMITPIRYPGVQADFQTAAPQKGFLAPDFTLETPEGDTITLSDYRGKPVLVLLWTSWCTICKATMPGLEPVYQAYAPLGFELLAVDMTAQDKLSDAISYFEGQNYSYPMLIDQNGTVARDYQMNALPTSILVGPDGIILDVVFGSDLSSGYLQAQLDMLLDTGEGK
jgi:cytochrome c biogenesis protein CcmG, thiol:disulfide interchange protein DsbE